MVFQLFAPGPRAKVKSQRQGQIPGKKARSFSWNPKVKSRIWEMCSENSINIHQRGSCLKPNIKQKNASERW